MSHGRLPPTGPYCSACLRILTTSYELPQYEDKLEFLSKKYQDDEEFRAFVDSLNILYIVDSNDELSKVIRNCDEKKCEEMLEMLERVFDFKYEKYIEGRE
ncbi:UNKNOWN [Stylonychia lemnae]|uniref:Uncharacterized protein n=1 Tax=Stylonychia lemnae TaxID=5949 RepID=A0A078ACQ2_STYLE|nr:UNKNOWN [Stylonychia lemnae]|eukprot:CDW79641.1 UNKNOWN [Stylonychia lemnae]